MSVVFGPSTWWLKSKEAADYYARICPLGTILGDGSAVWCREGGRAWIVAPNCTQISDQWTSFRYGNSSTVGEKCCICDWANVCSRLISCGFNPCDWFIPNQTILFTSYSCRAFWDTYSFCCYWSSSECNASNACTVLFTNGSQSSGGKSTTACVRSVRCVCL